VIVSTLACEKARIEGGVPIKTDSGVIRLGHGVVSEPTGIHSRAVQCHHGKAKAGHFKRKGSLAPPPRLRHCLSMGNLDLRVPVRNARRPRACPLCLPLHKVTQNGRITR
jgi:hypothetical protein